MTRSYSNFIKSCFLVLAVAAANNDHDTCAASPGGCAGNNADANTLIQSRVRISGGRAPDLNAEGPPDSDLGDAGVDIVHMGLLETDGSEPTEHVPGEEIGGLELDEEQYSKIAQVLAPTSATNQTAEAAPQLCACENPGHRTLKTCTLPETCSCNGEARLGLGSEWSSWKKVMGSIQCTNDAFGGDPWRWQAKECWCKEAIHPDFKLVTGVACRGENDLNDRMPADEGVTAETAVAACAAVSECIQVESHSHHRTHWQFSSTCTEELAIPYQNYVSYFRKALTSEASTTEAPTTEAASTEWTGPFDTDIPGTGLAGSTAASLLDCKGRCKAEAICHALQYSSTDTYSGFNCFIFNNQGDTRGRYLTFQIYKLTRLEAIHQDFKLVTNVACLGENDLNDRMPTDGRVTAETAVAACAAVSECVQVESHGRSRTHWQFSSTCTEGLATTYPDYASYFRKAP